MKRIDLFCASQASTAICMSMEQRSIVHHGGRAIDRHNPHLLDGRRSSRTFAPRSSQPPTKPKPYHQKSRKSSAKQKDLISPPGSTRYLLTDSPFFEVLPDFDPVSALVPIELTRPTSINPDESPALKPSSSSSSSSTRSRDQVVVLKVSLHCKGCEGKVKKHISKMQGVTSFSIDFAMKKVTVIGDVTPLGVLASVSRVKNAQLWPSSSSSPFSSSSNGSTSR